MRCNIHDYNGNRIYLDWKRADHSPLPAGNIVDNGVLIIPVVNKSAAGDYVCTGTDQAGNVLVKATFHVQVLCKIYQDLSSMRNTRAKVNQFQYSTN